MAQTFCEVWDTVAALLAELDLLAGFAELAVNAPMPYTRPKMLEADAGSLELIGCRWNNNIQTPLAGSLVQRDRVLVFPALFFRALCY